MKRSESSLLNEVIATFGCGKNFRIARNNTGTGKYCSQCDRLHKMEGHRYDRVVDYGVPGAPDVLGILGPDGRMFGIETKSESGRVAPKQVRYHAMVERFGGRVCVVRSVEEAREWMSQIGAQW